MIITTTLGLLVGPCLLLTLIDRMTRARTSSPHFRQTDLPCGTSIFMER